MWKRLNNPKGARQPVAAQGHESGTFEGGYGYTAGLNRTQSPPDRTQPPPRPAREEMQSELPNLPL
jgi:hypothetical protein